MNPRTEGLLAFARSVRGFMPDAEGVALYRAAALAAGTAGTAATAPTAACTASPASRSGPPDPTAPTTAAAAAVAPTGPLLEIGTYCGKSAVYLGAAAAESGTVLFSVDHHRGSEENQAGWEHHDPVVVDPESGRIDTLPWARRALEQAGLEGTVVLVVGRSAVVADHWSVPLSFLFVDGGHGRDVAWADYRAWTPKLAPGGLLAIHDVFPDPADGGRPPYELFCEALRSGRFADCPELACGSLRVVRRIVADPVGAPVGGPAGGGPVLGGPVLGGPDTTSA